MLNSDTKRKIDTLRDLLVGKIPNPQGQVQQITLALIYKFMSDIDDQTSGIFTNASFFAGEFAQYKWTHLMDSTLSAQERLNLYAEGLEKMPLNPKIPGLFKSIFKQAFLPYRDPTTLTSFLKKIDEFHYEHSEDLGDAFEYLLSCLSAAGDAGMFRTPRHIIDFIVAVVDPKLGDTILDPASGTAGFLISAYKYLVKTNPDQLSDFTSLSEKFVGFDISPDMVQLALVNLYLHNFPEPHIFEYDTLTSEDRRSEKYDCILANPPFMTPKGGIVPHSKFGVKSNRSEVLFVDYIMEHLRSTGKAGIIVPEGVIFQSANAYKQLRKILIQDGGLRAVVSLPAGVFNPYSGVKTSILLLDKTIQTDDIIFAKITADGYDLGAQRRQNGYEYASRYTRKSYYELLQKLILSRATTSVRSGGSYVDYEINGDMFHEEFFFNNDIPLIEDILRDYKRRCIGIDEKIFGTFSDFKGMILSTWPNQIVIESKTTILNSTDLNLSAERYKSGVVAHTGSWDMVELGEICEELFAGGDAPKDYAKERTEEFKYPIYSNGTGEKSLYGYAREAKVFDSCITISARGTIGYSAIRNEPFLPIVRLIVAKPKPSVNLSFLKYMIDSLNIYNNGNSIPQLTIPMIKTEKIPLPPLTIQEQIVKELDGYQAIIDGARQIVNNWKPRIEVDSSWETVKLGEMCENLDAQRKPVEKGQRTEGIYPYYGASGIVDYVEDYIFLNRSQKRNKNHE